MSDAINSPCIRLCTLNEHDVCVGCYRHIDEITGWHSASEEEKQAILERCQERSPL